MLRNECPVHNDGQMSTSSYRECLPRMQPCSEEAANCARVSDHHIVQRDEMSCALYNGGWTAQDSMCYLEHAPVMERVMNLNTPWGCL